MSVKHRWIAALLVSGLLSSLTTGCAPALEDTPDYRAACEGPPLRSVERCEQAMQDGYAINRRYDCIDKASFAAVNEQAAKWKAANTPEAIARRAAEFAQQKQRDDAERRTRDAAQQEAERQAAENEPAIVLRHVDVNTAAQADIAGVISVGPEVAAQIVAARHERRFRDWADLVNRVAGLGAAQPAMFASVCGLNVNGKSLDGAPPDARMAAAIAKKFRTERRSQ